MNAPQLLHRSSAMGQYGRPSQQQLGFLFFSADLATLLILKVTFFFFFNNAHSSELSNVAHVIITVTLKQMAINTYTDHSLFSNLTVREFRKITGKTGNMTSAER